MEVQGNRGGKAVNNRRRSNRERKMALLEDVCTKFSINIQLCCYVVLCNWILYVSNC